MSNHLSPLKHYRSYFRHGPLSLGFLFAPLYFITWSPSLLQYPSDRPTEFSLLFQGWGEGSLLRSIFSSHTPLHNDDYPKLHFYQHIKCLNGFIVIKCARTMLAPAKTLHVLNQLSLIDRRKPAYSFSFPFLQGQVFRTINPDPLPNKPIRLPLLFFVVEIVQK